MTAQGLTVSPNVLIDVLPGARVKDALLIGAGVGFVAIASQILIPLPFTPIPLSLSTFAVLLTGAALGPARAAISMLLYLGLGLVGLPIFGEMGSGWAFASFGYILGYVPAAVIAGLFARRRADRKILNTVAFSILGALAIYLCGVPWLMAFLNVDLPTALVMGVVPFLVGDAIKSVAAAIVLPSAWKAIAKVGTALR